MEEAPTVLEVCLDEASNLVGLQALGLQSALSEHLLQVLDGLGTECEVRWGRHVGSKVVVEKCEW